MNIAIESSEREAFDSGMAGETAPRPTPEYIDDLVRDYLHGKQLREEFAADQARQEAHLLQLVQTWGQVPAGAEKSKRLNGRLAEITVTRSDTITVNGERVETLKEALEANGYPEFFSKLFAANTKYEIVDGAESALKEVALPKRLAEKVLNLFGRCITVKPKKPSLKVTIADPAKPAKKAKGK